jgi:hypothetical protein
MYLFLTSSSDIEGSMALCRKKNFATGIAVEIRRTYLHIFSGKAKRHDVRRFISKLVIVPSKVVTNG